MAAAAAVAVVAAGLPTCRKEMFLLLRSTVRKFASQTNGEARVVQILKEKFPRAAAIKVVDISGFK